MTQQAGTVYDESRADRTEFYHAIAFRFPQSVILARYIGIAVGQEANLDAMLVEQLSE